MQTARLTVALPEGVPEWVHLVPAGVSRAVDGRGPFHLADPQAVIVASMADGVWLPFDENHSTALAAASGQSGPARGWIVAMEARPDGLWGRVEWNASGQALLTDKAYRHVSPEIRHRDGTIVQVLSAALTNRPVLTSLTSLFTEETRMEFVPALRVALGLAEAADEASILTAATSAHAAAAAATSRFAALAQAVGLEGGASQDALLTAIRAKPAVGGDDAVARLTQTVVGLETQLGDMRAARAREAAVAAVDKAIADGKPIVATREFFVARFMAAPDETAKVLAAMPSIHAGGGDERFAAGGGDGGDGLSATDEQVIARMGLDREAYVKHKAGQGSVDRRAV